jgi:diacylglycerol O-acyltransferase
MKRMPLMDSFFLTSESRNQPMHVGGVNLFTIPEGVDESEFISSLLDIVRYEGELRHPFKQRLKMSPLGQYGPIWWVDDEEFDIDYHIRHSALPKPGTYKDMFQLVSRLHSTLLDRTRPLWEFHIIEGLENRQFATYTKFHHCSIDGVGSMQLMNSMVSTDPKHTSQISPFSKEASDAYRAKVKAKRKINPTKQEINVVSKVLKEQFNSSVNVSKALTRFASAWLGNSTNKFTVPWSKVPKTDFNTSITGSRRFVAQSWPIERVKNVAKAMDGTLNDTVLAMCSGALRKHLETTKDLPKISLTAMTPVSLRSEDDLDSANSIGFITASLATNIKDPGKRFRAIKKSMDKGKAHLSVMNKREVEIYTMVTQIPLLVTNLLNVASKFPAYSTIISNVPGPREAMYWNGAKLDGMYPASIPFEGIAMNITLVSNNGNLDFGITACRRSVPHVQRLIDYIEDSLVELEEVAGIRSKPIKKAVSKPRRKAAVKK